MAWGIASYYQLYYLWPEGKELRIPLCSFFSVLCNMQVHYYVKLISLFLACLINHLTSPLSVTWHHLELF